MSSETRLQPEIQALRAVAVTMVVALHVWPDVAPGGFAGVDVFFVISGYLITRRLVFEADAAGSIDLFRFWARRAARLLPAALLVLAVTAVATLLFVPDVRQGKFLTEILSSVLYFENWRLAAESVDYHALDTPVSPVQHYWSLSLEEQLYVVWPLILLGTWLATRGRSKHVRRRVLAVVVGVLSLVSFAWAVVATAADPAPAYFGTHLRVWEFGIGGLLAILGSPLAALSSQVRRVLTVIGLAAIAVCAFAYGSSMQFPGPAALLPVLGALLVIAAGRPEGLRPLDSRAVQDLGRISYSAYLWHFPLVVIAPYAGVPEGLGTDIAIVALTIGLAGATTRWVEDPVRRSRTLAVRPARLTLGLAGAAMALTVIPVAGANWHRDDVVRDDLRETKLLAAKDPKCFGASSRDPRRPCVNPALRNSVRPPPSAAVEQEGADCKGIVRTGPVGACLFGAGRPGGPSIALVGDSHAAHWRGALGRVASRRDRRGWSITRTSCPFSQAGRPLSPRARARCFDWNDQMPAWFRAHPEVDTVVVAQNTGGEVDVPKGQTQRDAEIAGYRAAWRSLPPTVKRIVVLRDTPKMRSITLDCVETAMEERRDAVRDCAVPRARAVDADPASDAAAGQPRLSVIDLNNAICNAKSCLPVVGGVLVFKDEHHLTTTFSETLATQLDRELFAEADD